MRKQLFCLVFALAVMMTVSTAAVAQTSRKSVSAAEVNGTFKMNFKGNFRKFANEIKILALGKGKIRVAMDLVYPYTLKNGEFSVNMGSLDTEASIAGDTAVYDSDEFGACKITIKFIRPGNINVTQDGSDGNCGFGHNVFATGTYKKVSGRKPIFEE